MQRSRTSCLALVFGALVIVGGCVFGAARGCLKAEIQEAVQR